VGAHPVEPGDGLARTPEAVGETGGDRVRLAGLEHQPLHGLLRVVSLHRTTAVYEERVVVFLAEDFGNALAKAEVEAARYAAQFEDVEDLGYFTVYDMTEESIRDGTEVFSLMRDSQMPPQDFLDRYHDRQSERASDVADQS
jgi:hypothetical protein